MPLVPHEWRWAYDWDTNTGNWVPPGWKYKPDYDALFEQEKPLLSDHSSVSHFKGHGIGQAFSGMTLYDQHYHPPLKTNEMGAIAFKTVAPRSFDLTSLRKLLSQYFPCGETLRYTA